jgi:hypothetical protein
VQFLSRGQNPQAGVPKNAQAEEVPISAKVPAGTVASGGWGLAAKQLQGEDDATDSEEEDVEDIPF